MICMRCNISKTTPGMPMLSIDEIQQYNHLNIMIKWRNKAGTAIKTEGPFTTVKSGQSLGTKK